MKTSAKYYHLTVGTQGQAKWAKVALKSSTYDVTHKKSTPPNQKKFFRVQFTRLADLFEPLNSSLAQSARSLGVGKATENCCFLGRNRSTNILYTSSQSVKQKRKNSD